MAKSIAQQVADFLKSHPAATNSELYKMFPKVRENTLRNYKYKFKNSVDQFKNNRKRNRTRKTVESDSKTPSPSLRSKVFEFFSENPQASNQKLYEEFSNYSKNKLRHYKASFFKLAQSAEQGISKQIIDKKTKKTAINTNKSLEQRLSHLENQVENLTKIVLSMQGKPGVKAAISETAVGFEKKVKELEESISTFITTQRKKIKIEMSSLEEVQQLVTSKVRSFIKEFK